MDKPMLLYVLCEDTMQAEDISKMLLSKRLVACTNTIARVSSEFWWPPESRSLNKTEETLLLAKTLASRWKRIEKEVVKIHTYKTPAILAIPLLHVNKSYYDWIVSELKR
jgi:periplasmic divalent cation tolerance protein